MSENNAAAHANVKRTALESITRNRRLKAERIFNALRANGIVAGHIRSFTAHSWELAAQLAGYKHDKEGHIISAETKGIVAEMFHDQQVRRSA